jgi:hypothetical protein
VPSFSYETQPIAGSTAVSTVSIQNDKESQHSNHQIMTGNYSESIRNGEDTFTMGYTNLGLLMDQAIEIVLEKEIAQKDDPKNDPKVVPKVIQQAVAVEDKREDDILSKKRVASTETSQVPSKRSTSLFSLVTKK